MEQDRVAEQINEGVEAVEKLIADYDRVNFGIAMKGLSCSSCNDPYEDKGMVFTLMGGSKITV